MSDYKEFVIDYPFQGVRWGATIKAANMAEARQRIEAMGAFGRISGELMMTVPAGGGLFVRTYVWLRNFLQAA
jgi:hypothetical protein